MFTTGSLMARPMSFSNSLVRGLFAAGFLLLMGSIASAAPTINSPAVTPSSIPVNSATPVTFTASITDSSITTTGINLQRLDANGNTFSNVGTMYDDGTHGDAVAADGTFSLQLTLTESSPFPITFRISAPVKGSLTRIFSNRIILNVAGAVPAVITLTSPPNLAFVNSSPVTVNGTVSDPTATVTVNGLPAPVSGGAFTVSVAVQEGNNTLTASAKNSQGTISTASLQITLDTTPPRISIDAPFDSFATTDASITVSGKVNDTVVGTVSNQQVTATVNGINATVANRGFLALNVPLSLGNNAIVVTARDRAGNGATAQITVRRDNPTQSVIKIISGNNQTGAVGALVAAPIVAGVVDGAGNPVSGQIIVFAVTQNNGSLDSAGSVEAVTTNSLGQAQARWKLGTRSGAGNNIVEATAVGFAGSAIFTASGTPGNAGMVSLDAGNGQIGAVSQPLPHPFIVVVTDASHNRLANVPVTFQVTQAGGNFGGQASITTNSDSDGRAAAILTLGPGEGIENNVAEATFAGNAGFPAAFSASGRIPGNPAATKITGVVLDNSNNPVPGATIRAFLQNVPAQQSGGLPPNVSAKSDLQGQFSIQPAPVGYVKIIADGSTVQRPGTWPNLEYDLVTVSGQNNTIGLPIYLLPLDTLHPLCLSSTQGGTLTIPTIPGFSLSVLPGAATFPGGSKSGCVTVTAVHPDKIPMVPGFGQQPRFIVTIQPAGTLFNPPASVSIPNAEGLAPREVTEMYSFDHDLNTFVSIGSATVSDDGTVLRSDPGVGVLKAGWYCGGPPTPAGSVGVCGACKMCNGSACVADPLQNGNVCTTTSGDPGFCMDGNCAGITVQILSANVRQDQIQVQVGPSGVTGQLTLELTGPNTSAIETVQRAGGSTYSESFNIPALPQGDFTNIRATWAANGATKTANFAYHIKVHGDVRHSVYNSPYESQCSQAAAANVYITNASCQFTPGTLNGQFKSQLDLNGSGTSTAYGTLQVEAFCLGQPNAPADAAGRSYRRVNTITGSCGGGVGDSTVASYRANSTGPIGCGGGVFIYGLGSPGTDKTVADNCPACGPVTTFVRQLDNYTSRQACRPSAFTDLGVFKTIEIF